MHIHTIIHLFFFSLHTSRVTVSLLFLLHVSTFSQMLVLIIYVNDSESFHLTISIYCLKLFILMTFISMIDSSTKRSFKFTSEISFRSASCKLSLPISLFWKYKTYFTSKNFLNISQRFNKDFMIKHRKWHQVLKVL